MAKTLYDWVAISAIVLLLLIFLFIVGIKFYQIRCAEKNRKKFKRHERRRRMRWKISQDIAARQQNRDPHEFYEALRENHVNN